MGQRFTGKNLVQCWPRDSRQQCTGKILFHFVSTLLGQHCTGKETLYDVVQETPDNIAQEKTQCNAV